MKVPRHITMKVTEVVLLSHLPSVDPVVQEFTKTTESISFPLRHVHVALLSRALHFEVAT